ncbi:hypothetical protein [Sulfuracidifex metallicus]|uniref:hypothetical protein n=1 Tax=Sulfuracidifex metallicus TaxID=47303 RepID=UPI00227676FB|nr:hypothetical protein [Sulfuracidifex metallicus]MCY0850393.1 hypothetical protein [Sulfuracidifex metallicus]
MIPTNEIVSIAVTFVLGLLIGFLVKKLFAVGIILVAIVVLLMAIGYLSPATVESFLESIGTQVPKAISEAKSVSGYVPYDSIVFVIGFIIGLVKG